MQRLILFDRNMKLCLSRKEHVTIDVHNICNGIVGWWRSACQPRTNLYNDADRDRGGGGRRRWGLRREAETIAATGP